ncbi:hypothetical protein [Pedobacter frigoris]|uniref:hypothetical protein n=1 Tax=Pedobacter frigoris TaxID=2571272 RepID=UPI00292DED45|nr:hypothetical protein [Pedobacter frigoris]
MRFKLFLFLLFCATAIKAQTFKYPVLNPQGKTIKSLAPTQWKAVDSVYGDLNNDKIEDLAVIYEFYAAVKENRAYGDNTTELITEIQKPRILAIYFKSGRNYRLSTQNNNFILRSEEGGAMGDPLRPLKIADNKLTLSFEGGGNWRWKLSYTFRHQNNDWQLTKANNFAYHNSSGEMNDKQYDFVNKKRVVISGTIENKNANNEKIEQPLSVKALRTFTSFKKPWTWEIGPDEYL